MADTTTSNISLTKPEVGASTDTWGTKLNANFDTLDNLFTSGPALLVSKGGTGATTASGARTNLGLGSLAVKSTVETADISDANVTTAKIADANVTVAKLSATGTASSSTFLRGDGAWQTPVSPIGGQVFTSSGTFTIPTGVTAVKVTVVGGGGGGGAFFNCAGTGGGGGGGGSSIKYLTGLTPANTLAVTVGAGGTVSATDTNNSTAGGTSSVASGTQSITTISATGGAKGNGYPSTAGAGGVGSGGDLNITGGYGAAYNSSGHSVTVPGGLTILGSIGSGGFGNGNGVAGAVIFEW
jgi:hypothetical protein